MIYISHSKLINSNRQNNKLFTYIFTLTAPRFIIVFDGGSEIINYIIKNNE